MKSLYELKQLPRAWYQQINLFFTKESFFKSQGDYYLYIKQTNKYLVMVIIYVDDFIILASHLIKMEWLKCTFENEFDKNDFEELHYCPRDKFGIDRAKHTITKSQKSTLKGCLSTFTWKSANSLEPHLM